MHTSSNASRANDPRERFIALQALEGITCKDSIMKINVRAKVALVGKLEELEIALEPGEVVHRRTIELQQGDSKCEWVLWAEHARYYAENLRGCQVAVHGTRLLGPSQDTKSDKQLPRLLGCDRAEVFLTP